MAVDDLSTLRSQLPEIFSEARIPDGWDDDWFIVPIEQPEQGHLDQRVVLPIPGIELDVFDQLSPQADIGGNNLDGSFDVPDFGTFRADLQN